MERTKIRPHHINKTAGWKPLCWLPQPSSSPHSLAHREVRCQASAIVRYFSNIKYLTFSGQACLLVWRHFLQRLSAPLSSRPIFAAPLYHLWSPSGSIAEVSKLGIKKSDNDDLQPPVCAGKCASGLHLSPPTGFCNRYSSNILPLFTEQTLSTIFLQASPPVGLVLGLSSLLLSFAT